MRLRARLLLVVAAAALPLVAGLEWIRRDLAHRGAVQGVREFVLARMEAGGHEGCGAAPETWQDPPLRPGRGGPGDGPPPRPGDPLRPTGDGRRPGEIPLRPGEEGPRRPPRPGEPPPHPRGAGPLPRPGDGSLLPRPPFRVEIFGYDVTFKAANPRAPAFPEDLRLALQKGEPFAARSEVVPEGRVLWVALATEHLDGPCAMLLARRTDPGPGEDAFTPLLWSLALAMGLGVAVVAASGPAVRRIRRLTEDVSRSAAEGYTGTVTVSGSDEIADLAVAFNDAGAAIRARVATAEERERTLREFVANTTHDVMVPLTVLQGHLAHLRDVADGATSTASDSAAVREALEEAHYIGSLLHNLGAAARLEAGNGDLHRSPVDLGALVERVVARHRPLARAREVALDFSLPESPLTVDADLTLLEQAVGNLAHNAIRYNRPGGHVVVRLDHDAARPGAWSLRVLDDGPGIPPEEIARITERSYRGGAARTRHPEGQGLGLHIALEVARRHGYTLQLSPKEPNGLEASLSGAPPSRNP